MFLVKPSFETLTKFDGSFVMKTIENAGRTCYKSEDKITDGSAEKFVKMVIERGHHSVIEHVNITVKFICDRGVSHELVRHRLAAYSQESTRYCRYGGGVTYVIPPWIDIREGEFLQGDLGPPTSYKTGTWLSSMMYSEAVYLNLLRDGWTLEQARSVLPNSLKTEIVMTANLREWRHVLNLRCSKAAHPQMRETMLPLLDYLNSELPVIFGGIFQKCSLS